MVQKFDSIIINRCVGRINCLAYAHVIPQISSKTIMGMVANEITNALCANLQIAEK
jgi:hypothetical protein